MAIIPLTQHHPLVAESPHKLLSWWIMEIFSASFFYMIARALDQVGEMKGDENGLIPEGSEYSTAFNIIRGNCESIGLRLSVKYIEDKIIPLFAENKRPKMKTIQKDVSVLQDRIQDEMSLALFLHLPSDKEGFYIQEAPLFGKKVTAAFPSAIFDIEESGKCIALARHTAAVFHLMRVMEVGLRCLASDLSVAIDLDKGWQIILNSATSAVKTLKERTAEEKKHKEFCAEAAAHLSSVKIAWRNPVMHVRGTYTGEQVEDIFFSCSVIYASLGDEIEGESMTPKPLDFDFAIEIDFERESPDPTRVFRSMTALIESFEKLDRELVQSVDISINPILLLEDIEAGSLKTWFKNVLESIDDSSLKEGEWKKVVGSYLVKGKYRIINWMDGRSTITSRKEIKELEEGLLRLAEETDIKKMPVYAPVPTSNLLNRILEIHAATEILSKKDAAKLITPDGEARFNLSFEATPESLQELLVKEVIKSKPTLILKVKKPDYLGQSMWEFRYEGHSIIAKILDVGWLNQFQNREFDVRPQDALRVHAQAEAHYGHDGELIKVEYTILRVLEIIPYDRFIQENLLEP